MSGNLDTAPVINPWPHYKRLFKYACRYRGHLIIGVLGGVLCGGSMFFMLQMSSKGIEMLDLNPKEEVQVTATPLPATGGAAPVGGATPTVVAKHPEKVPGWLISAQDWAQWLHIPL